MAKMDACRHVDTGKRDCRYWGELCSAHLGLKGILEHPGRETAIELSWTSKCGSHQGERTFDH